MMIHRIGLLLCLMLMNLMAIAQEHTGPILWNGRLTDLPPAVNNTANKGTAIGLPFFEDFTDDSPYPNRVRWVDSNVYINNTMPVGVVSRGVATFDALNKRGRPYDTIDRLALDFADTLRSQVFDLSSYNPSDSIYLSYFYQPQGNGFSPDGGDSLYLFFHKKNGGWQQMWSTGGVELAPFRQAMISVSDTNFLYNGFDFLFVNKASINTNDDIWNLDYIRMAANRTRTDTAVNDLAFTCDQTNLLNDYVSMPYRQYLANASGERAATFFDSIRNHYTTTATVNYGYNSRELTTGANLSNASFSLNIPARSTSRVSFNNFTALPTAPNPGSRMVFETVSFLQSGNPTEPKANDTLTHRQIFDNYLAYDDGSAEKSYFLTQLSNLPSKSAIEFRLNQADTLRGMAIYFGQQVPSAISKPMTLIAYKRLAGINGATADSVITRVDDLLPLYTDSINKFTVYRFPAAPLLASGTFYIGYIQPANSGSDSLYIGLDVNRVGSNHLYYNTLANWSSSNIKGALLIRPLLGGPVTGTGVEHIMARAEEVWSTFPNPALNNITVRHDRPTTNSNYSIVDISGRELLAGSLSTSPINVSTLPPGLYLIRIQHNGIWSHPKKIIKQ